MNTPITKAQMKAFKSDPKSKFLITGASDNRRKRREHYKKDIRKPRLVIYVDNKGAQHRSIEYYQTIKLKNGKLKKIQHFA